MSVFTIIISYNLKNLFGKFKKAVWSEGLVRDGFTFNEIETSAYGSHWSRRPISNFSMSLLYCKVIETKARLSHWLVGLLEPANQNAERVSITSQ